VYLPRRLGAKRDDEMRGRDEGEGVREEDARRLG